MFYDKSRKVQLRINGIADIEEDIEHNKKIWDSMRPGSKLCYMGPYAPSQKINQFPPGCYGSIDPRYTLNKVSFNK